MTNTDPDDPIKDHIEHIADLNANLIGLVVKVSDDNNPGVLLHYQDGRILRLIATSRFVGVSPLTSGRVH